MNLVAKEFIASRTDGDGVLVLSEFTGASAELAEALLVNPYDLEGTADTLWRALQMPTRSGGSGWPRCAHGWRPTTCTGGRASSSTAWARTSSHRMRSVRRLSRLSPRPRRRSGRRPPRRSSSTTTGPWSSSRAPRTWRCQDGALLALLEALARRYVVHVVSGRRRDTLERWLGALPVGPPRRARVLVRMPVSAGTGP
jgi:trehalose 6-phosphate synthase/phosphatase